MDRLKVFIGLVFVGTSFSMIGKILFLAALSRPFTNKSEYPDTFALAGDENAIYVWLSVSALLGVIGWVLIGSYYWKKYSKRDWLQNTYNVCGKSPNSQRITSECLAGQDLRCGKNKLNAEEYNRQCVKHSKGLFY